MRLLEAPQTWIAAAVVLLVIAIVLLLLARRQRKTARPTPETTPRTPTSGDGDDRASHGSHGDDVDPPTGPIDLRPEARAADRPAAEQQSAAARTATTTAGDSPAAPSTDDRASSTSAAAAFPSHGAQSADGRPADGRPATGQSATGQPAAASSSHGAQSADTHADTHADARAVAAPSADPHADPAQPAPTHAAAASTTDPTAKDRLLAALLDDPDAAVHAVDTIRRANGSGPSGESVASLLRAGMTPAQVASLCGTGESALAEIVARDLGLLTGRNATADPGRAWASAGSAAGSTTPTTG